jgi:hypothetical protein
VKNTGNNQEVKFERKYLISWLICGFIMGVLVFIGESMAGRPVPVAIIFVGPISGVIAGGLLFLIEAAQSHRWNFSEVRNTELYWHIYPFAFFVVVTVGFIGGLFGWMKSMFR